MSKHPLLEEATIDELHQAIRLGRTTCVAVVAALSRARARLQRRREHAGDGGRRAGSRRRPARCAAGRRSAFRPRPSRRRTLLPDLDAYKGPPLEYGRMEPTASDPGVQQQFGMIVGMPNGAR